MDGWTDGRMDEWMKGVGERMEAEAGLVQYRIRAMV